MGKMEVTTEKQLQTVATHVLDLARNIPHEGAYVVALEGELGAGKTALVKYIAQTLGVAEEVTSPTFVIMKQYTCDETPSNATAFKTLVHIDAYRIEKIEEMSVLRFDEVLAEKDSIVCIEWANNIKELLPASTVWVQILPNADESRTITISTIS